MKIIYFVLGMICLVFGMIGVILPILPTTPFLLGAAFCLAKSSKKMNDWFIATKLYQNHIDSFVQEKRMTLKTKISILAFASIMLAFPFYFTQSLYLRLFIIFLYLYKYYYFMFKIKTVSSQKV